MESTIRAGASADFRLIETFRWSPGHGAIRLELHLARLDRSARELGFKFDIARALAAVQALQEPTVQRCRFELFANGGLLLTTADLSPQAPRWRLKIATERLDPANVWLRHKTTNRGLYDQTRAALASDIDEVVFLNTRDELCEGTITSVFVTTEAGEMLTPALDCGVLPGVLRQQLLESGQAREARLTLQDLRAATALHVGNSLRGLIPAQLTTG